MSQLLLDKFNDANKEDLSEKEVIVERLLKSNSINPHEAVVLLKTINISIQTDKIEMSSGSKIVGGSDFETTNYK